MRIFRHPADGVVPLVVFTLLLVTLTACSSGTSQPQQAGATVFEGETLITGDGTVIDNASLVIENDKITRVGKRGEVQVPDGAARIDLNGKTIMPAIIDAHSHLGHMVLKTGTINKDTYTRDNLVDHLRRYAYFGIAATQSMGIDRGEIPYEVRANPPADGALFHTAGRGIALPNAGPGADYWRDAAYGVTNEAEARKTVQELAAKKVDWVKIWVDDRNGTVKKLPPALYRVIIDEAHKNNLRVVAHIFKLEDAKELLRSGIDGFAHGVRDRDIDDEYVALFKQHPNVFMTPNLPDNPDTKLDPIWLGETLPESEVKKLQDARDKRKPAAEKAAREFFGIQARNLARLNKAGVKIALGTDAGTGVGWTAHEEMADMVTAGMSPSEVIVASTKTAAEVMRLDHMGPITAGNTANFIILNANPMDGISSTRLISKVYLRGKEIDRQSMHLAWTTP